MYYVNSPSRDKYLSLYLHRPVRITLPLPNAKPMRGWTSKSQGYLFDTDQKKSFEKVVNFCGLGPQVLLNTPSPKQQTNSLAEAPIISSLNQVSQSLPQTETMSSSSNDSHSKIETREDSKEPLDQKLHVVIKPKEKKQNPSVASKKDLYKLSTLIQNINPCLSSAKSDISLEHLDEYSISSTGLYMSKILCGFNWEFEVFFEKNKQTKRSRRNLRCKHKNCGKVFKKAWNLFDHMRIHIGKKPYACKFCGKCFAQNGNLTKHLKLHQGRRPAHDCDLCGKIYTEKFNLRAHLVNKHGIDQDLDFE
ncbi:unnamed protein product [Moneuplotes crassus]|uniref:C2H2-type domain-containing protein n=1 Tax=Euplotes crassus TaxID=5936 RepID=A0AAD2CVD4_EUPCR|nr:unnamed protein product [Moneuplotes crassus]